MGRGRLGGVDRRAATSTEAASTRDRAAGDGLGDARSLLVEVRRRLADDVVASAVETPLDLRLRAAAIADRVIDETGVGEGAERQALLEGLVDEVAGWGPLASLLRDPAVREIMVNAPDRVFVERDGLLFPAERVRFGDAEHVRTIVERLLVATGRRVDDGSPIVDARLPDGSRLNAVLPPIARGCPQLTIRRPAPVRLSFADLVDGGVLSRPMAAFLHAAVLGRCNVVVSGAAGAGKTTVLGALCDLVPGDQRIVVLEDVAEMTTDHPHVLRQETRPPGRDGGREVTLSDLVRNALRMRADRLVIGEVRGEEAFDMVRAMTTGHDGSMTSLHARGPQEAIHRLETLLAGRLGGAEVGRRWIAEAVDLVVHCVRDAQGRRWIASIAAIEEVAGECLVTTLHRYQGPAGPTNSACGEVPLRCLERMASYGVRFPPSLFAATGRGASSEGSRAALAS